MGSVGVSPGHHRPPELHVGGLPLSREHRGEDIGDREHGHARKHHAGKIARVGKLQIRSVPESLP